ncbi:MAG: hypothetical protein M1837_000852 [Sclerophora amabilis]|nr:MAG: hypothetical protein M1837_000852 [Sclerophora amabilis]
MICRKARRPLVLHVSASSRQSSPSYSCANSDWDADDEGTMSSSEYAPSRPLSLAIPSAQTPQCQQRWPTLSEVLSNTAPPPWTLSAFMAYLSQNHCLETLEFTMDAQRYRSHFDEMSGHGTAELEGRQYVQMLWRRLLDAYIIPDGPREVNLPSDVRDRLLSLSNDFIPPQPDSLEPAVKIIYELMEESVLVPFLNSASRLREAPPYAGPWRDSQENLYANTTHGPDDRHLQRHRPRRDSSPPVAMDLVNSSLSTAGSRANRSSPSASNKSIGSGEISDDSGGASSPGHEPMTPPTTPPTSDTGGGSPRSRHEPNGAWKKMTGKLGWKKRPGASGRYSHHEDEGHLA